MLPRRKPLRLIEAPARPEPAPAPLEQSLGQIDVVYETIMMRFDSLDHRMDRMESALQQILNIVAQD
jgi:hypothetical protein